MPLLLWADEYQRSVTVTGERLRNSFVFLAIVLLFGIAVGLVPKSAYAIDSIENDATLMPSRIETSDYVASGSSDVSHIDDTSDAPLVAQASSSETQDMHRLYNPNSGEHFYTAEEGERDSLVGSGWNYEGVECL